MPFIIRKPVAATAHCASVKAQLAFWGNRQNRSCAASCVRTFRFSNPPGLHHNLIRPRPEHGERLVRIIVSNSLHSTQFTTILTFHD